MAFPVQRFHDEINDTEFRFASSDYDLLVDSLNNLPHFSEPSYPALPTIPKPRIAKDRKATVSRDTILKDVLDECYTPFQDYLGLCHELDYGDGGGRSELSPSSDISQSSDESVASSDNLGLVHLSVRASSLEQLDRERLAAMSEFAKNGTTFELDEYDIIQQKYRGQETPTREIPVVPNETLKKFMWYKESKNAQSNIVANSIHGQFNRKKTKMICVFCKNNKEPQHVYTAHVLKDWRGYTSCPQLRKYPCPICQAIGDHAHTIKYCPFNNDSEFRTSPSPLRTSRIATGKKRRT